MAERYDQRDLMFPKLNAAQIARLTPHSHRRSAAAGEVIFDQGQLHRGFFVLLAGRLEIVNASREGQTLLTVQEAGEFTGEVDLLSGRPSLVRARALDPSELLEMDAASLRRVVQTDAELSEIFLRAFVLRRAHLIAHTLGDAVLIGSSHSADTLRLKGFLARNGHPHTYLDVERDPQVQDLLEHFGIDVNDIPVLICGDQPVFATPAIRQWPRTLASMPMSTKAASTI